MKPADQDFAMQMPSQPAERHFDPIDRLIAPIDRALRTLAGAYDSSRASPAEGIPDSLPAEHQKEVAALMRVNHSGEIAAQALYQGQAFVAKSAATRESLMEAGREESDHLAWCAARIQELGGRRSLLDPIWYAGSFAIGALAGLAGDSTSLGFVAETERQVVQHLRSHLERLPAEDVRTRAILEQMSADEERHGSAAQNAGGIELPAPARALMKLTGRIMTRTAFWL
jgi:ubiquinone biosynthesis monooxygenase Coq7